MEPYIGSHRNAGRNGHEVHHSNGRTVVANSHDVTERIRTRVRESSANGTIWNRASPLNSAGSSKGTRVTLG